MADRRVVPNNQQNSIDTQELMDSQASESQTIYESCNDNVPSPWARMSFVPAAETVINYVGELIDYRE